MHIQRKANIPQCTKECKQIMQMSRKQQKLTFQCGGSEGRWEWRHIGREGGREAVLTMKMGLLWTRPSPGAASPCGTKSHKGPWKQHIKKYTHKERNQTYSSPHLMKNTKSYTTPWDKRAQTWMAPPTIKFITYLTLTKYYYSTNNTVGRRKK